MILETSLGDIGRVGLLKVFRVEAEGFPDMTDVMLGNQFKTRQSFERFKSLIGLGVPGVVPEGEPIPVDDPRPLLTGNFTPYKVATSVQYTYEVAFVDRYNQIASLQPQLANLFMLKRQYVAASLYNLGFTQTGMGLAASETLFSTSHQNGSNTGSNRPAIDIALGPLAVAQMRSELLQQKSARGDTMPYKGSIVVQYPFALAGTAYALAESEKMPATNFNDKNFARSGIQYVENPYLTSQQAWFARVADNNWHKLFMLNQIPYDAISLPINTAAAFTYLFLETYVPGYADWHGTWATLGA